MNRKSNWRETLWTAAGIFTLAASSAAAIGQTASAPLITSANYHWDRVAIGGGGFATGILVHPNVPNVLYVRQDVSGLYRYDFSAQRWRQLDDFITSSYNDQGSDGIAIDPGPGREGVLYSTLGLATADYYSSPQYDGVWRSLNYGATWTRLTTVGDQSGNLPFGSNSYDRTSGERIYVDPLNSNYVYVATRSAGLYRSTNARNVFPTFANVPSIPGAPNALLVDPRGGTVGTGASKHSANVYVTYSTAGGGGAQGVWESTDGGATFTQITASGGPTTVNRMALGPNGTVLFPAGGISAWDGKAFTVLPGTANVGFASIATNPKNLNQIAAFAYTGSYFDDLYISQDGGQSWKIFGFGNGNLNFDRTNWRVQGFTFVDDVSVAFDPFRPGRIYFVNPYGAQVADNIFAPGPLTYRTFSAGEESTVSMGLATPLHGPGQSTAILYQTSADVTGFRSSDLTVQPTNFALPNPPSGGTYSDVAVTPANPRYVAMNSSLEGDSSPWPGNVPQIYESLDDGASWLTKNGPGPDPACPNGTVDAGSATLLISPTNPDHAAYIGAARVAYTTNFFSGSPITWTLATSPTTNQICNAFLTYGSAYGHQSYLAIPDAVQGDRYYAGAFGTPTQIYTSGDGGKTWAVPPGQTVLPAKYASVPNGVNFDYTGGKKAHDIELTP